MNERDDDVRVTDHSDVKERLIRELHLLDALGGPNLIAAHMWATNTSGRKGESCNCPVANYLADKLGVPLVSAGPTWTHAPEIVGDPAAVPTPPHVTEFMRLFDKGAFPHLEDPS